MRGLKSKVPKAIQVGTRINIADNSGARKAEVIGVIGYKGVKRRLPKAGVGDVVICTVKEGNAEIRHQVVPVVIIRQKKPIRRKDGRRIMFEDNAGIILKDLKKGEPKGSIIKGPVAREAIDRFSLIGRIAKIVI